MKCTVLFATNTWGTDPLAIVSDLTRTENPEWWGKEVARQKEISGDEGVTWTEIDVDLPDDEIEKIVRSRPTVKGSIA